MPTYQYRCTECGEDLEAVQKFSDAPLATCPACGGRLRKVFNAVGVVFKGSGFYRTDSRNGSANGSAAESRSSDKSSKVETKSSENKPADTGSNGSSKDKQPVSSGASSTGQKPASS
jgi:putative FmdB family regulatory protein